jgi:hypothetical protein
MKIGVVGGTSNISQSIVELLLEQGMTQVFEVIEREGRIPNSDEVTWEDEIVKDFV